METTQAAPDGPPQPIRGLRTYGPFLIMLLILNFTALMRLPELSHSFALWFIALGAMLSVSGAVHPSRLVEMERGFFARITSDDPVGGKPGAPSVTMLTLGSITFLLILQSWTEISLWLPYWFSPSVVSFIYTWGERALFVAIAAFLLGGSSKPLLRNTAGVLLLLAILMGTIYSMAAIILALVGLALRALAKRFAMWLRDEYGDRRHPDWISPSLYYGLSAVAAGSFWLAFLDAPPVRWWGP